MLECGNAPELSELLRKASQKDEAAIAELFDRYYFRVCGFVRRFVDSSEIEDVAQEVFISVLGKLDGIEKTESFESYLFQSARNRCINWLRKKTRLRNMMDVMWHAVSAWQDSVSNQERRKVTQLDTVLEKLPETLRSYLHLFYVEKHSRSEIALLKNESSATVYRKLAAAKARLLEVAKEMQVKVIFQGRHDLAVVDIEE